MVHYLIASSTWTFTYSNTQSQTLILKRHISILLRPKVLLNDNMMIQPWSRRTTSSCTTSCLWSAIFVLWRAAISSITSIYTTKGTSFINEGVSSWRSHILLWLLLWVWVFIVAHPVVVLHILETHILTCDRHSLTYLILFWPYGFVLSLEESACDCRWSTYYDSTSCLWYHFFLFEHVVTTVIIKLHELSGVTTPYLIRVLIPF